MDSLGVERMTALNNVERILKASSNVNSSQSSLFGDANSFEITLEDAPTPATKSEKLGWEKELIGLYVTEHPLKDFLERNNDKGIQTINDALKEKTNKIVKVCGIISKLQRIQTKTGASMLFVKLEDLSDNIEILVFSEALSMYKELWEENNPILVLGKISKRDGDTKLICQKAQAINL